MRDLNTRCPRRPFVPLTLLILAVGLWITAAAQAQHMRLPKNFAAPSDVQTTGQLPASQQLGLSISLPTPNLTRL